MKRSKRFLSAVLVICMVLSMLPSLGLTASAAAGDTYQLVTDVKSLSAGDTVIIVAADYNYALSTTQNNSNRAPVAIVKESNNTINFVDNIQELKLEAGADGTPSNSFSFYTGSGYLYTASSSSNTLKTEKSKSVNSSWSISIENNIATIKTVNENVTRNWLRYNSSSTTDNPNGLFACYASGQQDVCIYKKTTTTTSALKLSYSVNGTVSDGGSHNVGDSITLPTTATEVSGYTFMGWSETVITTPVDTAPASLLTGSYTMPAQNTILYAVYAKGNATDGYTGYTTAPDAGTTPSADVKMTVNIRCGEGTAYVTRNGEKIATTNQANNASSAYVSQGDVLTVVMKPATGYHAVTLERDSTRVENEDWTEVNDNGTYFYQYTVESQSSVYFNVSFLPRRLNTGVVAEQASTLEAGLYVITGVPSAQDTAPESTDSNNAHDVANTYLLYGNDGLTGDVIGRKSAALKLSDIGVTLDTTSPYQMANLNEACLFEFTPYKFTESNGTSATYYTIRMCGATTDQYLTCTGNSNKDFIAQGTLSDNAYWSVTVDTNGVAKIVNKAYPDRYLKFMDGGNYQFRTYATDTNYSTWPVLYKASQIGYLVSYSKTGGGMVTAYNVTKGNNVVSGSVQAKDSQIRFTFTPSEGYELTAVTLNGEDILSQVSYNTYAVSKLDQSVDVVATFTKIDYKNAIKVNYYVNSETTPRLTLTPPAVEDKYYYVDLSPSVTVNGTSHTYADLTFSKAVNGDAEYTSASDPILISNGDTIDLYFLTTAVTLQKTATETTKPDTTLTGKPNGGTTNGSIGAFSGTKNNKDENDNVKQTFEVNLHVESSDMIPGYTTAKPTDIILVLDDSNSMFPNTTDGRTINNAKITKEAINAFLDVALKGNNRVAVVRYNSYAGAWNGSSFVQYGGSNATYSTLTEANCFMSDRTKINTAVSTALTQDEENGATNTMGGFMMAQIVAETRDVNTTRNLMVLLFTDGEPTVRYAESSSSDSTVYYSTIATDHYDTTGTENYSGARTSDIEYDRALYRGQQLRKTIDQFTNAENYIYSVALLGGEDYVEADRILVEYLMSTSPKGFTFGNSHIEDLRDYVYTTDRWFNASAYSNAYFPVTSNDATTVTNEMIDIFKQIAYTTVADSYITGTLTDTIPAEFKLTDTSKKDLEDDGWTVTHNADGTTTITKDNVVADKTGTNLTYEIEYQGGGVGSVFTNTSASFIYTDILTGTETTGNFAKPAVSVVAWTVDDELSAEIGVDRSINVTNNDPFNWLTEGGYTFTSYKIRLTDKDGNDKTYYGAVDSKTDDKFDAFVDENSQTVSFYTLTPGTHTFYYVVEATVLSPDGKTKTTVYSRATTVEVKVTNLPTVNDADVVKAGEEKTIDVLWNDTLKDGVGVTTEVILTDAAGTPVENLEGIDIRINPDGTITYKTSESEDGSGSVYEFYYVVKQTSGELTLASQPTKVTVYSVESQYLVVDFGLATQDREYRRSSKACIADDITLDSELSVSDLALRENETEYGTMTLVGNVYSFTPNTTNFNGVSVYEYTVAMSANAYNQSADNVSATVTVIPANNVYYEENFISFTDGHGWADEGTVNAKIQQDTNNLLRHGYDPGYDFLEDYSDGKALENYSNGNEKSVTVSASMKEANGYFTFTGTGFDLYGECGPNSGVIVAEVYEGEITKDAKPVKVILVDTYLANATYYQIPVVMCRDLEYNTYTVKLRAFYNAIFDHNYPAKTAVWDGRVRTLLGLDADTELICLNMQSVDLSGAKTAKAPDAAYGQYNVYVDAIRIYNPLGTLTEASGIAYTAYHAANEVNPVFVNINDTILDAANETDWANTTAGVKGVLYLASNGESANEDSVFDAQTMVCLGASGTIKTVTDNGKDYLLDKDGNRITYEGADVYVQDVSDPNSSAGKAFFYDKDGSPVQLNRGQLSTLDIYCYENKYDAIGPENEVYLKNDQGLAFKVPENTHIQISAKVPYGSPVTLMAYTTHEVAGLNEETAKVGWHTVEAVSTRTELYYDLTQYVNSDQTLILKCVTGDANAVLSLCNIKGVGSAVTTNGAEPLMTVDAYTLTAAMDAFYPMAHTHSYTDTVTAPTCTEQGYTTHTCECSDSYVDSYVNALGHDWDDGVVTLAPTATGAGVKTYTCSRCSETYTEALAPLGEPCDGGADCPSAVFTDVSANDWYHLSIDFVAEHDLMGGIGDSLFDPEGTMNRAMLVTVLWRCEGKPTGAKNPFSDVPAGEWYTDAVAWAAENGIVNGVGDGKFDPTGNVTREQIAVILCRYTEVCGIADTSKRGDLRGYPDAKDTSDYATDALSWAVGEELFLGSEGKLLPQGDATRAQVATILMRYLENIAK